MFRLFQKKADDLTLRRRVWIHREYVCVGVEFDAFLPVSGVASGPSSVGCSVKSTLALTDPEAPEIYAHCQT